MDRYYTDTLSAQKLKRCYEIAPPRVNQYLKAEIQYVLKHIEKSHRVIELGCGYGRVLKPMEDYSSFVVGLDTSLSSLMLAQEVYRERSRIGFIQQDAVQTGFQDGTFDIAVCIQNGISAFKRNPVQLVKESMRITRDGGICLFSSYSEKFWEDRLEWFVLQANEGLLGEIDWDQTKDGNIVCKDGFTATTYSPQMFRTICEEIGVEFTISEIDDSSLFCTVVSK